MNQQGQQGALEQLKGMPMDIIAEVRYIHSHLTTVIIDISVETLQYLWPMDLYNLTEASNSFCIFLSQPHSNTIWKSARHSAGVLIDCPRALSEREFARLIFGNKCHVSTLNFEALQHLNHTFTEMQPT